MPDQNVHFTFKEVAEALVKQSELTEGHWGLLIKFGIQGTNLVSKENKEEMVPAAVIPVLEIGLQRFNNPNPLSVDAAVFTSRPAVGKKHRTRRKP